MRGTVVRVLPERGFFFIKPADGLRDVFGHVRDLDAALPLDESLEGRTVEFDQVAGTKGPQAKNIRPS